MAVEHQNGRRDFYVLTRAARRDPTRVGSEELRYLAVAELAERRQTMSPRDLAAVLEKRGFVFTGSGNKAVADALRWEVRKGRVVKPARGRYRIGVMPKSTRGWIVGRARRHRRLVDELAEHGGFRPER